jgi:hypothetical protein
VPGKRKTVCQHYIEPLVADGRLNKEFAVDECAYPIAAVRIKPSAGSLNQGIFTGCRVVAPGIIPDPSPLGGHSQGYGLSEITHLHTGPVDGLDKSGTNLVPSCIDRHRYLLCLIWQRT